MFSVSSARGRRAALVTLLLGVFAALTPLAAFATGTVTLAWDPSPGTNIIANYKVYYGVASATYTNSAAAGTNTTVSVSNLVEGATYYFAATAVDTSGLESDYSTEVSTLIPIKLTNQPPTLNALANVTINESAGLQTVNLSGITSGATNESQTLTVTASSSNTGLIPNPDGQLHQPQHHRLDHLHPGRLCLRLGHHHRHRQRWRRQQQHRLHAPSPSRSTRSTRRPRSTRWPT